MFLIMLPTSYTSRFLPTPTVMDWGDGAQHQEAMISTSSVRGLMNMYTTHVAIALHDHIRLQQRAGVRNKPSAVEEVLDARDGDHADGVLLLALLGDLLSVTLVGNDPARSHVAH